jgi:hypothetical protein
MDWQGAPPSPSTQVVKKILRLEVPVDSYPNVCSPTCAVLLEVHTKEPFSCFKLFVDIFFSYVPVQFCGAHFRT